MLNARAGIAVITIPLKKALRTVFRLCSATRCNVTTVGGMVMLEGDDAGGTVPGATHAALSKKEVSGWLIGSAVVGIIVGFVGIPHVVVRGCAE